LTMVAGPSFPDLLFQRSEPNLTWPTGTVARKRAKRLQKHNHISFAYSALACLRIGDVGVSVFPEVEKVLICSACAGAGGIGFDSVNRPCLEAVCPGKAEMAKRTGWTVPDNSAMVKDLLKLVRSEIAVSLP
jgi:hypothetical protein